MTRKTSKSKQPKTGKSPSAPQIGAPDAAAETEIKPSPGGKRRGPNPKSRAGKRWLPPGRGGQLLRDAVDRVVDENSSGLAETLVSNSIAGNMKSMDVVVEMSGADHPPVPKKKKRRGLNDAERMAAEPQWDPGTMDRAALEPEPWDEEDERLLKLAALADANLYTPVKLNEPPPIPPETE